MGVVGAPKQGKAKSVAAEKRHLTRIVSDFVGDIAASPISMVFNKAGRRTPAASYPSLGHDPLLRLARQVPPPHKRGESTVTTIRGTNRPSHRPRFQPLRYQQKVNESLTRIIFFDFFLKKELRR